ncbi:Crp/Fnr family transcriptional regulator [Azospirillum argentinense]
MTFSVAAAATAAIVPPPNPAPPTRAAETVTGRCAGCSARSKGLCGALTAGDLPDLSTTSRPLDLLSATPVVMEGEEAEAVFTVMSGMLKLYKTLPDGRQQITGFATAGDVIGLAVGSGYAYTAETVTASTVCRMSRTALRRLMDRHPAVQGRLLAMTSVELSAAQDQILLLGCKTAVERVSSFLLALSRRSRPLADGTPSVFLPMPKVDIGAYLGLRPETLSRVLRKLEVAGAITRLTNDRIRIEDPAVLEAAA